jgi:hypothetical protein
MTLDLKRLRADAANLKTARSTSGSSRETTGTTKAIRAALPEIYKLRDQDVQWADIAAALAAQGVVQGKDRTPLTTNRLTALVRQIELQTEKRQAKKLKTTPPIARSSKSALQTRHLSLSSDLKADTRAADERLYQSEDEIRRLAFEHVKRMTKKD